MRWCEYAVELYGRMCGGVGGGGVEMGRGRGDGNEDREIWGDLIAGKIDWLVWLLGITWDLDCMGCRRVVVVLGWCWECSEGGGV